MNSKKITRIFLMLVFFIMIHMVSVNASVDDIVFDNNFYAHTQGDVVYYLGNDANTLRQHYKNSGIKEGRQGSVYFDAKYYLEVNKDVAAAFGAKNYEAAYNHFVTSGINEGRIASKVFNVKYFLACNSDIAAAVNGNYVAAYEYYMRGLAAGELRTTIATFDLAHYLANNKDIAAAYKNNNAGALRHYLTDGIAEGRNAGHVKVAGAETKVISELTCTTDGIIEFPCSVCNGTVRTVTKATGHDMKFFKGEAVPTCTEKGVEVYKCANCDYQEKKETEALGHEWVEKEGAAQKDPTCTEKGIKVLECKREGCKETKNEEIPATGKHTIDATSDVTITKLETCTEPGSMTFKCKDCNQVVTEERPITHNETVIEYVPATCKDTGKRVYKCNDCGATRTETIKKNAHKMVNYKTGNTPKNGLTAKAATCTEAGQMIDECSVCGEYKITTIPATGHKIEAKEIAGDGKTECGKTTKVVTYECSKCHAAETHSEKTEVVTHKNFTKTKTAGVNEDGHPYNKLVCTGCGRDCGTELIHNEDPTADAEHYRVIKRDHYVEGEGDAAVAYTDVTYVCNYDKCAHTITLEKQTVDPEKDCIKGEAKITTKPTCHSEGEITYNCTICDRVLETEKEKIPADYKLHKFNKPTEDELKAAAITCQKGATIELTCTVSGCGHEAKYEVPADKSVETGKGTTEGKNAYHNWKELTDKATTGTCSKNATKTYECQDCKATLVVETPDSKDANAHDYAIGYRAVTVNVDDKDVTRYYVIKTCVNSAECKKEEEKLASDSSAVTVDANGKVTSDVSKLYETEEAVKKAVEDLKKAL